MATMNRQITLAARPTGLPKESDFKQIETALPVPKPGEFLVRILYLSVDPYMRGRMSDRKSYAAPVAVGDVMIGATVGEVLESRHARFAKGDIVLGMQGWQSHAVSDAAGLTKLDPARPVPLSVYLGAAGMPGVTAFIGLFDLGTPRPGETVVVAAAAGAVGSVVGQLAKLAGCRAVGIAGGAAKCEHVVRDLGFDACVDHRGEDFAARLAAATPSGVDVYFENVGGEVLDAVLPRLNPFARIPLCGIVSQYNASAPYGVKNFGALLTQRVRLQGFIVSDHMHRWPAALAQLGAWVAEKKLVYRESVAEGLASAPRAFIGMLRGENLGKQLVKVS